MSISSRTGQEAVNQDDYKLYLIGSLLLRGFVAGVA